MKFCANCGAELEDSARFCGKCGHKVEEESAPEVPKAEEAAPAEQETAAPANEATPEKSSFFNDNKKLIIGIAAGCVAFILLLIIIISACSGGYKKQIKTLVKYYNKEVTDSSKFLALENPSFEIEALEDMLGIIEKGFEDSDDFEDMFGENGLEYYLGGIDYEDLYDDYEDKYGSDWKITYEIKDVEKIDKDDLEDLQDDYRDAAEAFEDMEDPDDVEDYLDMIETFCDAEYDDADYKDIAKVATKLDKQYSKIKISKGYKVKVKFKIKGKDDHESIEKTFKILKINGDWYLDDCSLNF